MTRLRKHARLKTLPISWATEYSVLRTFEEKRREPAKGCSRNENGYVPNLNLNEDKPELNYNNEDNANPNYGSVSRGSVCLSFLGFNPTAKHFTYLMKFFLHVQILRLVDYF